jgi:hypothetical protein
MLPSRCYGLQSTVFSHTILRPPPLILSLSSIIHFQVKVQHDALIHLGNSLIDLGRKTVESAQALP